MFVVSVSVWTQWVSSEDGRDKYIHCCFGEISRNMFTKKINVELGEQIKSDFREIGFKDMLLMELVQYGIQWRGLVQRY